MQFSSKRAKFVEKPFIWVRNEAAGYATEAHVHDCHMLFVPRSGAFETLFDNQPRWLTRRHVVFVPGGAAHANTSLTGRQRHLVLYTDPKFVAGVAGCSYGSTPSIVPVTRALDSALAYCDAALADTSPQRDARIARVTELIVLEALSPSRGIASQGDNRIEAICAFVRSNLGSEISLDTVATKFGLSRRHLSRLFRTATGTSFHRYLLNCRLSYAMQLLRGTNTTVIQAALDAGFESPAHFSKVFRERYGLCPGELKQHVSPRARNRMARKR